MLGRRFDQRSGLVCHSLALATDGTLWSWGANDHGQLGDGSTERKLSPVRVTGLGEVTIIAVAGGATHSVALDQTGRAWAWGSNSHGQLGDGTTGSRSTPGEVSGAATFSSVAAGDSFSLALDDGGAAWGWGANNVGQVGNGDGGFGIVSSPAPVDSDVQYSTVLAGGTHDLAVTSGGDIHAWGLNLHGQLGFDTDMFYADSPGLVEGVGEIEVTSAAAGLNHSRALTADGTVWGWGANDRGQLGDETTAGRTDPVPVSGPAAAVTTVASFDDHSIALTGDGTAWAWGYNQYGQIGDGTTTTRVLPVPVTTVTGTGCPPGATPLPGVDPLRCSLQAGTEYTYELTVRLGSWSATSDPLTVTTATP